MREEIAALAAYLDDQLGGREPVLVEPMVGGGSCEISAVERAGERTWPGR